MDEPLPVMTAEQHATALVGFALADLQHDHSTPTLRAAASAVVSAVSAVLRAAIADQIAAFADDDSDVSDAYRHAALIAKGTPGA